MGRSAPSREAELCAPVPVYRSAFSKWDERASVRVKPRRRMDATEDASIWFPPELVPVATHPLVTARGPAAVQRLLVHRLHMYLSFTVELESTAVVPVTTELGLGRGGLDLPDQMRHDALAITTDEAWHAQFSAGLAREVAHRTGVVATLPASPRFLTRLDALRERMDPAVRGCASLAFAVVSETLVSGILADLPKDRRLPTAVRELVADHAEDEGRHHAYFRSVLGHLWPALDDAERRALGPLLPEMITIFLEPDLPALSCGLLGLGLSDAEIGRVLLESHPEPDVRARVASAARATVRYVAEVGALDDARTREAFVAAGML